MAHNGFCTNAQIIKSIKKRYKKTPYYLFSSEMLFLEEFLIFLEEATGVVGHNLPLVIEKGKEKYNALTGAEKLRYIKLADEINAWAFDD